MKKLLLLNVLICSFFICHAQTSALQKAPDDVQFNNHQIRVFKTAGRGYGYDIFFQHTLILHQVNNPFTNSPEGLKEKEDALKTAKWQVAQMSLANKPQPLKAQTISMDVARQLKISVN